MADVWLCNDPRLNRQVAIKTLPAHDPADIEFTRRFEIEAQAAAALTHPHIVSVHDYGEHRLPDGKVITYIVMPFIPGGSLADRIEALTRQRALMPVEEALTYLSQAADAIDYAHQQGLIHRDIKPGNMLLRDAHWLLLSDFGIAHLLSNSDEEMQTGAGFGTPEYMSPEQARGRGIAASDIYSLAVIAFQLFTGRLPFMAETTYTLTVQHILAPPPSPRKLNPQLPVPLDRAILHGLEKEPARRPASARAFFAEIIQAYPQLASRFALNDAPSSPTPIPDQNKQPATTATGQPPTITQPPVMGERRIFSRRAAVLAGGGAIALLLMGGGAGAWYFTRTTTPPKQHTQNPTPNPTPKPNPNAPTLVIQDQHINVVTSLAWSPVGNTLTSVAERDFAYTWNVEQMQTTTVPQPSAKLELTHGSNLFSAWSPDGKVFALANTGEEDLLSFDSATMDFYTSNFASHAPGFAKPVIANDLTGFRGLAWIQKSFLFSISSIAKDSDYEHFYLWGLDISRPQQTIKAIKIHHFIGGSIGGEEALLQASPDRQKVAIATTGGVLVGIASMNGDTPTWQDAPGLLTLPQDASFEEVTSVAWSPDNSMVAGYYNSNENVIAVWALAKGKQQQPLIARPLAQITSIAWGTNGQTSLIATGTPNGQIQLWDPQRFDQPVATLSSDIKQPVQTLAWSTDNKWLAASYKDNLSTIHIWKMQGRAI